VEDQIIEEAQRRQASDSMREITELQNQIHARVAWLKRSEPSIQMTMASDTACEVRSRIFTNSKRAVGVDRQCEAPSHMHYSLSKQCGSNTELAASVRQAALTIERLQTGFPALHASAVGPDPERKADKGSAQDIDLKQTQYSLKQLQLQTEPPLQPHATMARDSEVALSRYSVPLRMASSPCSTTRRLHQCRPAATRCFAH
jgi:hypothetical protein